MNSANKNLSRKLKVKPFISLVYWGSKWLDVATASTKSHPSATAISTRLMMNEKFSRKEPADEDGGHGHDDESAQHAAALGSEVVRSTVVSFFV